MAQPIYDENHEEHDGQDGSGRRTSHHSGDGHNESDHGGGGRSSGTVEEMLPESGYVFRAGGVHLISHSWFSDGNDQDDHFHPYLSDLETLARQPAVSLEIANSASRNTKQRANEAEPGNGGFPSTSIPDSHENANDSHEAPREEPSNSQADEDSADNQQLQGDDTDDSQMYEDESDNFESDFSQSNSDEDTFEDDSEQNTSRNKARDNGGKAIAG